MKTESSDLELRLAAKEDAAAIAEIYRPFVLTTPISFETDPPDKKEMERRIIQVQTRWPWLVCTDRGRVVGYAYGTQHRVRSCYQPVPLIQMRTSSLQELLQVGNATAG